jgi:hypothetical protein
MCSFLLVSCGPTKHEEKQEEKQAEELKTAPVENLSPQLPEKKNEEGLTPQQREELEINEDNVMNPLPG